MRKECLEQSPARNCLLSLTSGNYLLPFVFAPVLLVLVGFCLPAAPAFAQESDTASTGQLKLASDLTRIREVIEIIRREYVESISDNKLVESCEAGMDRSSGKVPTREPPNKSELASSGAQLDRIRDLLLARGADRHQVSVDSKLAEDCLRGMLAGLDDASEYLDESTFRDMKVRPALPGGVGIAFKIQNAVPVVIRPEANGPAERAGILRGDRIVKINGVSTIGAFRKDLIERLNGPIDSEVSLTIERGSATIPLEIALRRVDVFAETVLWRSLAPGYAYIRITLMQEITPRRLGEALESVYRENSSGLKGLILDLRNSPGGLLNVCVGVAAAFLGPRELVTKVDGRARDAKMTLLATREHYLRARNAVDPFANLSPQIKSVPMLVLVNRNTTSGAEIVAAALQDHRRARVSGVQTEGLVTIQTIFPLARNTAAKITTAKFFRPSGKPMDAVGITPDVLFPEERQQSTDFGSSSDVQLMEALKILSSDESRERN